MTTAAAPTTEPAPAATAAAGEDRSKEKPYWRAGDAQAIALAFLAKMGGRGEKPMGAPSKREILVACAGAFVSLLAIALVNEAFVGSDAELTVSARALSLARSLAPAAAAAAAAAAATAAGCSPAAAAA
jgi:hypothetical protein